MSIQFSRLKMFRKQSGYTQEEIAEKLGVSRQAVAKWEKGETLPDIESCIKLADLYEIPVDSLVRNMGKEEHSGDGKHIFGCSRINTKGQITLPANCRKVFNLKPGDHILIMGDEDKGIALVNLGSISGTISRIKDKFSDHDDDEE
ncbi:MAG: helix-turn-helix domain-containing protein [Ruminococcus sp.]|nr:helix-turn-helix domain-containing protein [Ruminococcus sp.]